MPQEKQQHEKITGYNTLSQNQIDLLNKVKAKGNELQAIYDELSELEFTDKRWVNIGRTELQQGIMAWGRSITNPNSF